MVSSPEAQSDQGENRLVGGRDQGGRRHRRGSNHRIFVDLVGGICDSIKEVTEAVKPAARLDGMPARVFVVEGDINDGDLLRKLFDIVAFTHVLHLTAQAGSEIKKALYGLCAAELGEINEANLGFAISHLPLLLGSKVSVSLVEMGKIPGRHDELIELVACPETGFLHLFSQQQLQEFLLFKREYSIHVVGLQEGAS
ncbi:hypothetical protein Droror1_Dr00018913 [Drosera rotundifolia]